MKILNRSTLKALLFFTLLLPATVFSQTASLKPVSFNKAVDLYNTANFIAAEEMITVLLKTTPENDPSRFDLDYYRLMCLVRQNNPTADSEISAYLEKKQGSPWENQLWFELAKLQFTNKRFPIAARTFQKVDASLLTKTDREDFDFYKGYSNFEAGNMKEASQSFFEVKKSNSKYAQSASYYWGYINYLDGNYKTALDEFGKLKNDRKFSGFIDYYTIQIYYLQERYDDVIEMGPGLVTAAPDEQRNELLKIVGDAYYQTGKYINAIQFLDLYKGVNGKKTPEDFFRLGYCYYMSKDYNNAIKAFEKASIKNDALAQNAFYHLADCYLQTGDKNKARVAFEQASKFDFDPLIEEDALFNFAKLTYELSYSPFNETIKAFDQYITKYPDSKRNDSAFDYLVKVYMTTRNYRDAITSIEKIKNQTPAIKESYQRVTLFRGLELFNDGHYTAAIEMFNKSIEHGSYNRTYNAQALYWSAESYFRAAKYNQAIELYQKFLATPGAFSLPEFGTSYYNIGYSYFHNKNYNDASTWFRKYLAHSKRDNKIEADAANRTGDCFFQNRQYDQAIEYYTKAHQLNSYDPDYALFQIALCYGLKRDFEAKKIQLNKLTEQYKRSSFVDDAYFEIARTHERTGNIDQAIETYKQLINQQPNSNFISKARLQLGLIYYNRSENNQSLENYKKIVENYPASEEAKAALIGIKNNYVDMNNVDGYFAYVNNLGGVATVSVNEQDSIFYMAAEKSYMENDPNAGQQLETYLQRYPDGSFKTNATFYLAEHLYAKGEYSKSLVFYEELLEKNDNIFTEQSLIKAAELNFNAAKYEKSFAYFTRLEQKASSKWNLLRARLGTMRCNYQLKQPELTVKSAITLLATENITELMKREANFKLAKSYYDLNNHDEALKYFNLFTNDTKSVEGAESKYYKAEILFNKKQYTESENEIMDFISKNTPHQYWLAKSFLLLSDIYLQKEDIFQAKHTLRSIIDNYNIDNDGILDDAKTKIAIIENIEKETVNTNQTNETAE
ncbi:MAG: tetratricopeptide repeat protein [Prolixibacteraceae bacterium]|nr:tetratricopeptide repeat protein [Prolixibacteraceae bacterium]